MQFTVTTEAPDPLDLRALCEKYVNELWILDHLDREQAAEFALDHFKRTVVEGLETLEVKVK